MRRRRRPLARFLRRRRRQHAPKQTSTLFGSERVRGQEAVEEERGQFLKERSVMAVRETENNRRAYVIESPRCSEKPDASAAAAVAVAQV
ncbi:hypothetical protein FGB62_54g06 [Gracilaria domingensis]|nr:hypothetical protein FGB62_54g06 [Gracilaria domingensis]